MKKALLKKLQSLTAILALNTLPLSIAHATVAYEAEALQARVLTEEKRTERLDRSVLPESLSTLFFENSLAFIQKNTSENCSDQTLLALALIEESYQDEYDALLDRFELSLLDASPIKTERLKREALETLSLLKSARDESIEDIKRQLS
ncbi:hypothetical protein J9B83_13425 [Marinomonas sp. A79]|uniref:Uncharacterized protein n=1 Tax=Marinomonas vulgaris TaxID=2823372 RepID=A0ABS5HEH5_9GAMM|nr:hypothetical protein [Marinomonas vulgaris]MBR7889922.1 hypothetical protein [Marinomonas vulgaris]